LPGRIGWLFFELTGPPLASEDLLIRLDRTGGNPKPSLGATVSFGRFWRRQWNDFGGPVALHNGRDPFRRAVRYGAEKAITAGRTMAYARACFAWGKRRAKVPENPFANLPISGGTTERERVLSDTEIAEVWAAADRLAYPFGPFFKLAILTLQRREEVAGMRWSEVADDLSHWTLPGSRLKNGRPHDVHLSEAARAILRALPRVDGCDFVFSTTSQRATAAEAELKGNRRREPTPISGFSQGKRYLDAEIEKARAEAAVETGRKLSTRVPWRLHDLRRTGVTTLAALGFDSIVVDKLLAHQPAKLRGVAGVYQRHDFARERAAALDAWAAHVLGIEASNIVHLRAG